MRDFDQLEIGFVHGGLEGLVAIPIAIRFLEHDTALEQQALKHRLDIELFVLGIAYAERNVFKVAKHRHADSFGGGRHLFLLWVFLPVYSPNPRVAVKSQHLPDKEP